MWVEVLLRSARTEVPGELFALRILIWLWWLSRRWRVAHILDHGAGTIDIAAYPMIFTREPIGYRRGFDMLS